jgi:hypothetical protein
VIIFRFFSHSFFTENFELIVKDFESRNLSLKGLTVLVGGGICLAISFFPRISCVGLKVISSVVK